MNIMPTYLLGQGHGTFVPVQGQGHGGFMQGNFPPGQGPSGYQPIPGQGNYPPPPGQGNFGHFMQGHGPGSFMPGQMDGSFLLGQGPIDQSRLTEEVISDIKSQGLYDQFRKECISAADMKPAYRNLRLRVETNVMGFLGEIIFSKDLNKGQLREQLRKHINESNIMDTGVERIVEQLVVSKINTVFRTKVEEVVYKHLGIENPTPAPAPATDTEEQQDEPTDEHLLPKDLEAVSSDSSSDHHSRKKCDQITKASTEIKGSVEVASIRKVECSGSDVSGFSALDSHDDSNHSSYTKRSLVATEENVRMEMTDDVKEGREKNDSNAKKKSETKTSSDKHKSHKARKDDKDKSKSQRHSQSGKSDDKNRSVWKHVSQSKDRKRSENSESSKKDGKDPDKTDQMPKEKRQKSASRSEKLDRPKEKSEKLHKERESSVKDKKLPVNEKEFSVKGKEGQETSKPNEEKSEKHKERSSKDNIKSEHREISKDKKKCEKEKSGKEKTDREKSDHKSRQDKDRSSSSKPRTTSSSSKKGTIDDKNSTKEKSSSSKSRESSHKEKDKHSSTSHHKHSSSDKSKDRSKSSSSSKNKDKKSSGDSKSDKVKKTDPCKSDKKEGKKVTDDHYSFKDKKYDRRSTDRDSNDESSKNNNFREDFLKSQKANKATDASSSVRHEKNNDKDVSEADYEVEHETINKNVESGNLHITETEIFTITDHGTDLSNLSAPETEQHNPIKQETTNPPEDLSKASTDNPDKVEQNTTNERDLSQDSSNNLDIVKEETQEDSTTNSLCNVEDPERPIKKEQSGNFNITEAEIMAIIDNRRDSSSLSAPETEPFRCEVPWEEVRQSLEEELGDSEPLFKGFTLSKEDMERLDKMEQQMLGATSQADGDDLVYYFEEPHESEAKLRKYNENIKRLEKSIEESECRLKAEFKAAREIAKKRKLSQIHNNNAIDCNDELECKRMRLGQNEHQDVCDVTPCNGSMKVVANINAPSTKVQKHVDLASGIRKQLVINLTREVLVVAPPNDSLPSVPDKKAKTNGFKKPTNVPLKRQKIIKGAANQRYSTEDLFKPRRVLSTTSRRRHGGPS